MAIRSAIPWPLRWLLAAVVLGLSGAVALWAFEFGRDISGYDRKGAQELLHLREEVTRLTAELEKAQAVSHTAENLLTTERTTQTLLATQLQELQNDNRSLRRDLGFFEQLIPTSGQGGVTVRGVQARRDEPTKVHWQVLLVQSAKNAPEFRGQLEVNYTGDLRGKPWTLVESASRRPLMMGQSLRVEGSVVVPADAVVKIMSVRLLQGETVVLTQATKVVTGP
jgi:hypothetical protein